MFRESSTRTALNPSHDNSISDSNGLLVAKVYRLLHRGLWTGCMGLACNGEGVHTLTLGFASDQVLEAAMPRMSFFQ